MESFSLEIGLLKDTILLEDYYGRNFCLDFNGNIKKEERKIKEIPISVQALMLL